MNHATVLGLRSIVLAIFAMVHAFVPFARGDDSIFAWGVLTVILGVLFLVSYRVTPGSHAVFVLMMALSSLAVGGVAIIGGLVVGPQLLAWTIVVFGVVVGMSEIGAALRSTDIPRQDHLLLGGASLMLALASLVMPADPTWLSGVMVAWAAIGAVLAGTASIHWKDHISAPSAEETVS